MYNLLTDGGNGNGNGGMLIFLAVVIGLVVVMNVFSARSQKKKQQAMQEVLNAVKPGTKVKTIGGICGTVVEVCREENTFVLETGNEANGKSYIKFDMVAIYQSDAKKEEAPVDAPVEEAPVEAAPVEEVFAEEAPVEEAPAEEAPVEETEAQE